MQRDQGNNPAVYQQLEHMRLEELGDLCHVSYHRNNALYLRIHISFGIFSAKIKKFRFM